MVKVKIEKEEKEEVKFVREIKNPKRGTTAKFAIEICSSAEDTDTETSQRI